MSKADSDGTHISLTIEYLTDLPDALVFRPQWLIWKKERQSGDKKDRKVPYYANGRRRTG